MRPNSAHGAAHIDELIEAIEVTELTEPGGDVSTAREMARELCDRSCEVSLILVQAQAAGDDLLGRRVREVAARHQANVELIELAASDAPDVLAGPGGAAFLLVMRRGELFTQAAGPLPTTELERVVRTALSWGA